MADGIFASLVSKDRNANATANPIYVQLSDGTSALSITSGALDVNIDNATIAVTQSGTWDIGTVTTLTGITNDVNIADGGNSITVDNAALSVVGGGTEATALRVTIANDSTGLLSIDDNGGSLTVDGTVAATQSGSWDIGTVTTLTGITNDVNIADGGNSITVDGTVAISGTVTVDAVNLDIRDLTHVSDSVKVGDGTDLLAVNSDGSINVNVVSSVITGEIHDYDTASAVASDASDNHDYAVANSVFLLKSVIVAGSGNVKAEIQVGPVASLATVAVAFLNGRQGDTKQIFFDPPIEVPVASTGTVRVIRTNRQGNATDVYSTIIGLDV